VKPVKKRKVAKHQLRTEEKKKNPALSRVKKAKPVEKRNVKKHQIQTEADKSPERLEEEYTRNEKQFDSFLDEWRTVLAEKDAEKVQTCLSRVFNNMKKLSTIYVRDSGIRRLMLDTESLLEERGVGLEQYNSVWIRMREMFMAKLKELPKGFRISKQSKRSGNFGKSQMEVKVRKEAVAKADEKQPVAETDRQESTGRENEVSVSNYMDAPIPRRNEFVKTVSPVDCNQTPCIGTTSRQESSLQTLALTVEKGVKPNENFMDESEGAEEKSKAVLTEFSEEDVIMKNVVQEETTNGDPIDDGYDI